MTRRTQRRAAVCGGVLLIALAFAGCAPAEPVPTGDELFENARQNYLEYRTITNNVQALIFDGPWESDIGGYGMQPTNLNCEDDEYRFDLMRTTRLLPEELTALNARVLDYLDDAGYEVEGQNLGSGTSQSLDLIVNRQAPFRQLMITTIGNGSVLVSAETQCWPGDSYELGDLMFGDENLSEGYLPTQESPSDPLFFGVTPGEPEFTNKPGE